MSRSSKNFTEQVKQIAESRVREAILKREIENRKILRTSEKLQSIFVRNIQSIFDSSYQIYAISDSYIPIFRVKHIKELDNTFKIIPYGRNSANQSFCIRPFTSGLQGIESSGLNIIESFDEITILPFGGIFLGKRCRGITFPISSKIRIIRLGESGDFDVYIKALVETFVSTETNVGINEDPINIPFGENISSITKSSNP
jgi:hypothetical protein